MIAIIPGSSSDRSSTNFEGDNRRTGRRRLHISQIMVEDVQNILALHHTALKIRTDVHIAHSITIVPQ